MSEITKVQWFPGHMTKTKRKIEDCIGKVDVVAEIIDARIPVSSRNPVINEIVNNKPKIILLNKSDAADPNETAKWIEYYAKQNIKAIAVDCKSGRGLNKFIPTVQEVIKERLEAWANKGMVGRTVKVMIVGIPNVGKSSFINKMANNTRAKVEDRPGVTRGNQWYTIGKGFDMLDTPGVLWPKFEDLLAGERLAFTGAVKDVVVDYEHLASRLAEFMSDNYPKMVCDRFKLDNFTGENGYELLEKIGKKRGMLVRGGGIDLERASVMFLDEFRSGAIGRVTLEKVEEYV